MIDAFFQRAVVAGITGAAEALYPSNDFGAPDWRDVDMVERTLIWIAALPPRPRGQIRLLFGAIELAAPLLAPGLRRFSRMSTARRVALIRRWRRSRLLPLKLLGDSLKASTSMIYLSHPAALAYIGLHKTTDNPHDPLRVEVRPDALNTGAPVVTT